MFDFNANAIQRTVTAGIGAVLVSFAFIGAAVGPARAAEATVAVEATSATEGQSYKG